MSLILPRGPSWDYCTTTITGTPSATNYGVAVTAGANNADGTSVALLTNLAHDVEFLIIGFSTFNGSAVNGSTLADILIDPAGGSSWAATALIDDLLAGYCLNVGGSTNGMRTYYFPISLKAGHSIGCRARCAHTSTIAGRVFAAAFGGNKYPDSWWCGKTVTTIGADPANSRGTLHTSGSSGTYSSWTNLGSTIPANAKAWQFAVQGEGNAASAAALYNFEFGVGGQRFGPPLYVGLGTAEVSQSFVFGPVFRDAPSGAQLQVRATSSTTGRALDVAGYAVH